MSLALEVFHYSLDNIRQGWATTASPIFHNSAYLYLDTEATLPQFI